MNPCNLRGPRILLWSLDARIRNMNTIGTAQDDMRKAYFGGATGAVCSATAWLAAAVAATFFGSVNGIITLIIGGMFIFPASIVLSKALGRTGKHDKANPLAGLAIGGTFWMLLSIPIAVAVSLYRVEWFFPAMLLVIGGRYLTFPIIYGMKIYWAFGVVLALSVFPLVVFEAPPASGAFTGALIEYVFGVAIFITNKSRGD